MGRNIVTLLLLATLTFVVSTLFLFFLGFESLEAIKFGVIATALNFLLTALLGLIVNVLYK